MGVRHLLVSDIDGTLLRKGKPTPGLKMLKRLLRTHRNEVALVYATGRSFNSTLRLIESRILPVPHAIAPFVGTEVWLPRWYRSSEYQKMLQPGWEPEIIRSAAVDVFDMKFQEAHFQSEWKLSFYEEDPVKVGEVERFIAQKGIAAKVVYSCDKFLDIIPAKAGKASVVQFLQKHWQIDQSNVLTCGDSGNDLDMLTHPETCNVAVGNLEDELADLADDGSFYVAELPYAGGVLEGAVAFDFWPAANGNPLS